MTIFTGRERTLPNRRSQEPELAAEIAMRRNRLLGRWAAVHLGLAGGAASSYAAAIGTAAYARVGDENVAFQIRRDFLRRGVDIRLAQIMDEMVRLADVARTQVASPGSVSSDS